MVFGLIRGEKPTVAQRQLLDLVCNDNIHAMSSFELNQMASLSYGDVVCDELFEALQEIQGRPLEHSVLAVQKSLVVAKHMLIYGSDHGTNHAIGLRRNVEALREFNTVLWSQQQLQGAAAAWMFQLKGGGVDKGLPVRQAAQDLFPLLVMTPQELQRVRNDRADPNSLVPVGDKKTVFLSDDARHYLLRKRIEQQYQIQTKSNLAKADGGFGGGYSSRDGKNVVGAAHGLEEMIKVAQQSKNRFTDDGINDARVDPNMDFIPDLMQLPEYNAAAISARGNGPKNHNTDAAAAAPAPAAVTGDLLDFGNGHTHTAPLEADLLGGHTADLLGGHPTAPAPSQHLDIFLNHPPAKVTTTTLYSDPAIITNSSATTNGLLDFDLTAGPTGTAATTITTSNPLADVHDAFGNITLLSSNTTTVPVAVDPFASISTATSEPPLLLPPLNSPMPPTSTLSMNGNEMSLLNAKPSVMSSGHDRFAALDALEVPSTAGSILAAKQAENRVLSSSGSGDSGMLENLQHHYGGTLPSAGATAAMMQYNTTLNNDTTNVYQLGGGSLSNLGAVLATDTYTSENGGFGRSSVSSTAGAGGLKIAQTVSTWGGSSGDTDDADNGFVMGGIVGSGLEPAAAAPAAPPPPPPPY